MKNMLCVLVGLGCLGAYYYCFRPAPAPAPAPAAPVVAATPAPTPRLYYHSPLDAPAMAVEAYTGMGYYSPVKGGFDVPTSFGHVGSSPNVAMVGYETAPPLGSSNAVSDTSLTQPHVGLSSAQPQGPLGQAAATTRANAAAISMKSLGALAPE